MTDLHIISHAEVVALLARPLTPDEGGNGAKQAHEQLHANNQPNLEIQEAVIRACRNDLQELSNATRTSAHNNL